MSLRTRLRLAFLAVVILPLIGFSLAVRKSMSDRLTEQYQRRVEALLEIIEDDLARESAEVRQKLALLAEAATEDNRLRLAAVRGMASERTYLLDYTGDVMPLAGLTMLQIQDDAGRIISSGHFRNEFDRLEPELPDLLAAAPGGAALARARSPAGPFLALVTVDSFQLANQLFTLVGGTSVGRGFLARLTRDSQLSVSLIYPGGVLTGPGDTTAASAGGQGEPNDSPSESSRTAGTVVEELSVPFVDAGGAGLVEARFVVRQSTAELRALRGEIDKWFLIAVGATLLIAYLLATWLASRVSRPLVELARKTARVDLDRLDIDFASPRKDEVGALSRLLGEMTERLRASAGRLKEAERRATIGELARQVNHDIKNGLTPIRNIFRHLLQVAGERPGGLTGVFLERQTTLESSIAYLESLAANYARLYPRMERRTCDLDAIIEQVVTDARHKGAAELHLALAARDAGVSADPVALRRIIENLVDNAVDSLEGEPGTVTVSTELVRGAAAGPIIRIIVSDTGCGMSEGQRARIFDDFYTTKADGTGLGLSIVRRLVLDLNGTVRVESLPKQGSRFIVDLPGTDATGEAVSE
ncbi:MAG: HAMP domain-containing protein [Gemmatimonadota bacterium]|nr:MAG: HAMP domain-containing protein [Gemmatimonadota bacterium]